MLGAEGYSTAGTVAPRLERTPVSVPAAMLLAIAGTVCSVLLVNPMKFEDGVAGATSLMTRVAPTLAPPVSGVSSFNNRAPMGARPGVHSVHSVGRSSSSLMNTPQSEEPIGQGPAAAPATGNVRQWAAVGLATVLATVLTLINRLRPKKAASPAFMGTSSTRLGTAVLDRPVEAPENHIGKVSAEEAVNLPFTMKELKEAIPAKCFEKSLFWSMFYFARDWGIVGALYFFQPQFFGLGILGKVLWMNILGFYGWCLFVVGHDCGHGTFSKYGWINQFLGHVCHAPLLVPFNGWRISHRHHHQYHNDVDRDHSWRPSVAAAVDTLSPIAKFLRFSPLILLVYPFYLISPSQENGFSGCHFWPWNPLYKKEERAGIAASALSVVGFLGVIGAAISHWGFMAVLQGYIIPYWIFVAWLDLVTLMQHTDENALYFRGETWNYLRGAMSTVDRTYRHMIDPLNLGYGRVIDHLHHNISDGHVIHHIFFTQIPHYRLMAATEAIKPILGKHYRFDPTPVPKAFMDSMNKCWYVEDEGGVVAYKGATEYKEWEAEHKFEGVKKAAAAEGLA